MDLALSRLVRHPCIIAILGHRGSGKSAVACRIQELLRDTAPPCAVGLPPRATRLLPDWYGLAGDLSEVPPKAVIYIPESYRVTFHARATQTAQGRLIGEVVNLFRHRRHTLIFDVQNPAHLDRNIISEADMMLVKEPGPFTQGFERPQLKHVTDAARGAFAGVSPTRRKRAVWVVAPSQGVDGKLMENLLPSFWTSTLSRIYGETSIVAPSDGKGIGSELLPGPIAKTPRRRAQRSDGDARRQKARLLKEAGYSYGEIDKIMGISMSQAFRLVKGS